MIHPERRAYLLNQAIIVEGIVLTMLSCMVYGLYTNEAGADYQFSHTFTVFFIKLPCSIALHLLLYPEVCIGMNVMKFANQNPNLFVKNGSEIAFLLGFLQVVMALFCESINVFLLTYQHTVDHCIIHFVALEVIMDVPNMYFEAMMDNKLKEFVHHQPRPEREKIIGEDGNERFQRGKDIIFSKRSCFHKFARILYKVTRGFYVGFIFYFVPVAVLFLQFAGS